MLRSVNEIIGYVLEAENGEIGRCKDFLFDDRHWAVRYMVADTGKWLPGRKVLVSPIALDEPEWPGRRLPVKLTRRQIEDSPPLSEHEPVSRKYEIKWFDYYTWPSYWAGRALWGETTTPAELYNKKRKSPEDTEESDLEKSCVRSVKEVTHYDARAADGDIGRLHDFILDDCNWILRYLVVGTHKWLPGRKVLIASDWVGRVDWVKQRVFIDLTTETIENSPEYDPSVPVNRKYEVRLYDYYGRPPYWE